MLPDLEGLWLMSALPYGLASRWTPPRVRKMEKQFSEMITLSINRDAA